MPWVCAREVHVEEDVIEREVSRGKCRILESVLRGKERKKKRERTEKGDAAG